MYFIKRGEPLFLKASEMVSLAEEKRCSLGEIALMYESTLLKLPEKSIIKEMEHRYNIMRESVFQGLKENPPSMRLLHPCAGKVYNSEKEGKTAIGGLHTRAAARAMAALHINCGMGIVCAAPTGGSAGVIPGVLVTLAEEKNLSLERTIYSLLAAGGIGLIVAERATFAAEVAGCQVEIGAATAMASAAVVEAAGGSPQQAIDAAAISFQNTMGSVCDLVQGTVEIPCHTRNATGASSAFVCADLILGGYENPVSLDETIDAVYSTGKMLPAELRCTSLGGLAVTPSAKSMKPIK
ncbi:L-serine ammonia-lyase, iron-sulfur-dependent, subunit alpha [candidate division KSB1 bacterium]|nr:MAG: L-serine ammonia-lyase, iron-sulfur-dependent, subunit alpha [candidate division KSB1 bacterium]